MAAFFGPRTHTKPIDQGDGGCGSAAAEYSWSTLLPATLRGRSDDIGCPEPVGSRNVQSPVSIASITLYEVAGIHRSLPDLDRFRPIDAAEMREIGRYTPVLGDVRPCH